MNVKKRFEAQYDIKSQLIGTDADFSIKGLADFLGFADGF